MSKRRSLQRLAMCFCLMIGVLFLGQVTVFADEVKPIHEYNFDSDARSVCVDTGIGSILRDGISYGSNNNKLFPGYGGSGKSRYFDGQIDFLEMLYKADGGYFFKKGGVSVRFQMKKNSATHKLEAILSSNPGNFDVGYFIGIEGDDIPFYFALPHKKGALSILNYSAGVEIQTPESVCDGEWHDVLFTWDGTTQKDHVKLYLDDMSKPIAVTTATEAKKYYVDDLSISIGKFHEKDRYGGERYGKNDEWHIYNGYLDNLQIYNTAITPEASTPVTPLNLKATAENSKIDLTWDAVDKATSYSVKRSTTAGGPYTAIANDITGTSYTDTDVKNGTTYYYIVSAINAGTEIANSNEASAQPTEPQTPPTTEAKLKVVLEVAESLRLSVDDDLNVNTQMSWTSSDPTVATVNEKGIVTALAPGNTVITVKSVDGSYTDYINVLVVENADDYRLAVDLKIGETARLTADDFTNTANITWAPMDSSIANVTTKGKVTALSKGLVLITAKDTEGNIIGRIYVRVRE